MAQGVWYVIEYRFIIRVSQYKFLREAAYGFYVQHFNRHVISVPRWVNAVLTLSYYRKSFFFLSLSIKSYHSYFLFSSENSNTYLSIKGYVIYRITNHHPNPILYFDNDLIFKHNIRTLSYVVIELWTSKYFQQNHDISLIEFTCVLSSQLPQQRRMVWQHLLI